MSRRPPRWYTSLIILLSAQPLETPALTVSLAELEVLAGAPVPLGAYAARFWMNRSHGNANTTLAQVGWQFIRFDRDTRSVTFVRVA